MDPQVGAVIHRRFDAARAEARDARRDALFPGVPTLLKDSLSGTQAGVPYFAGNRVLKVRPYVPKADSPMGSLLRQAGFITLGVTKMPELAWMTTTQPLAFGPTRNPWNLDHSVGGSSGGSAAAVACGMVPVANAVENGGSIRMPASFCGVVGLKPTRARVPLPEPNVDLLLHTFMVTRSVRDTSALLHALEATDARGLFGNGRAASVHDAGLRVGVARQMGGIEAHPECQRAVDETVRVLERIGCRVQDSMPAALKEPPGPEVDELARCLALTAIRELEQQIGRGIGPDDVEPFTWYAARPDLPAPRADRYVQLQNTRRAWSTRVLAWWDDFDILVSPTLCDPPPTLASRAAETPQETAATESRLMGYTAPFDDTGQPAITLPLHWSRDGLPIGVQLVADSGRDEVLLALAAQLELAMPWRDRAPRIEQVHAAGHVAAHNHREG